jgi:hypothetical protein
MLRFAPARRGKLAELPTDLMEVEAGFSSSL